MEVREAGLILVSLPELISGLLRAGAELLAAVAVVARVVVDVAEAPLWPRPVPGGCWEQLQGAGEAAQEARQPGEPGRDHGYPAAGGVSAGALDEPAASTEDDPCPGCPV